MLYITEFIVVIVLAIILVWITDRARKNEKIKDREREEELILNISKSIKTISVDDIVSAYKKMKEIDEQEATKKEAPQNTQA